MQTGNRTLGTVIEAASGRYIARSRRDLVSRVLFVEGVWDPLQITVAEEILRDIAAPLVLDVGCNLGAFSVPMGVHLFNRGTVIGFDAQRSVFYQACGACALNGVDNVYLHNLAVGDVQGHIDVPLLDLSATNSVGSLSLDPEFNDKRMHHFVFKEGKETVPMITLDTFLPPAQCAQVSLIKVDVEGFELEVFKGADKLLRSYHPTLMFEAWDDQEWYQPKRERLLNHVHELGYKLTTVGELLLAQHPDYRGNLVKIEAVAKELRISRVRPALVS